MKATQKQAWFLLSVLVIYNVWRVMLRFCAHCVVWLAG